MIHQQTDATDPRQRFAALVKSGRERLGLKQEELAVRVDVSQPTVSGWETGRTLPSFPVTLRVAAVLGLPAVELVEILTAAEQAATDSPAVEPQVAAG